MVLPDWIHRKGADVTVALQRVGSMQAVLATLQPSGDVEVRTVFLDELQPVLLEGMIRKAPLTGRARYLVCQADPDRDYWHVFGVDPYTVPS